MFIEVIGLTATTSPAFMVEKEIIINTKQIVWFAMDKSKAAADAKREPRLTTIVHMSDGECHRIKIGFPDFKKLVGVE